MKMNQLGRTGIEVSEICLGTMTWGDQNSEAEAHQQMDFAVAQGINFFDTAEMYPTNPTSPETQGRTEEIHRQLVRRTGRRKDIVLATKVAGKGPKWIRGGAPISAGGLRDAVAGSLGRLKTDYIDLYQLHWPNRGSYHFRRSWTYDPSGQDTARVLDDLHEALEALSSLVREGKIRAVGLSNESAWGTMQFLRMAQEHGFPRVATIQNEYNLLCRYFDLDMAEVCHHEDVGLMAFSPLAAGLLTGKYQGGAVPAGSRRSLTPDLGGRYTKQVEAAVDAYLQVAEAHRARSGADGARLLPHAAVHDGGHHRRDVDGAASRPTSPPPTSTCRRPCSPTSRRSIAGSASRCEPAHRAPVGPLERSARTAGAACPAERPCIAGENPV